ncbi:hypothetical protein LCGC14_0479800 [marine sediment metagenome]|uniref:Uncharacterized protein n=1 Tax=marine sediment metagenome TaxID=412755 RepID=A0A0F9SF54_9ZZZZ
MIKPKVGQIWKLDFTKAAGYIVRVEILEYNTDDHDQEYFDAKCIETTSAAYNLGEVYGFYPEGFLKIWIYCGEASKSISGIQCIKCKADYPYAEAVGEFTCWSCKNGY